jgi:hypothetical protein
MFITLKVDPAEDPARDVTPWKGRLPKDAPTPQQKAQMEEQARQEAALQAQKEEEEKKIANMADVLTQVLGNLVEHQVPIEHQPVVVPPAQPLPATVVPIEEAIPVDK